MSSPQHCLAMADEAERLAGIVSYERDRERLRSQAAAWRQMAGAMSTPTPQLAVAAPSEPRETRRPVGVTAWLTRRRA